MALYEQLKIDIQNAIRENGNHEITGYILQKTLLSMIDVLGEDIYSALGNSSDGVAKNSLLLEGHPASYFATAEYAKIIDSRLTDLKAYINSLWTIDENGYLSTNKPVLIKNFLIATGGASAGSSGTPTAGLISGIKVGDTVYNDIVDNSIDLTEAFNKVSVDLSGYAKEEWVLSRGYITSDALTGYATQEWILSKGYITNEALAGYATQEWVLGKGYITSAALTGYATQEWVLGKGYITSAALTGYATQKWVLGKGYALATDLSSLKKDFDALYKLLNDDTAGVINTWNEVVNFLKGYGETTDLATILAGINADIAKRALATRKISTDETTIVGGGDLTADRTLSLATSGVTAGTYTKVTVDKYGRVTKGASLTSFDIPTIPVSKIQGLSDILNSYVTLTTSQIISGVKTFNSYVYITQNNSLILNKDTEGIYISGNSIAWHNASNTHVNEFFRFYSNYILTAQSIFPSENNSKLIGSSNNRWSNVYSVLGNFSGQVSVNSLKIGSVTLTEKDGILTVDGLLVALNGMASATALSGSVAPGALIFSGPWSDYTEDKADYALATSLGYELYNTTVSHTSKIASIETSLSSQASRITALENKATSVKFTQSLTSGKTIGSITIDGSSKTLYAPSTYAWSEITSKPNTLTGYGIADAMRFAILGGANYVRASFMIADLAAQAASTFIEFWSGTGWYNFKAGKYIVPGGTSSHFLKGDGSLDSNTYLTTITKSMVESVLIGNINSHSHSEYLSLATGGTFQGGVRIDYDNSTHSEMYIGREDNDGYVYLQDIASQSGISYWLITTAGKATFKNTVTASGFIKSGSSDSYVLLGAGGHKAVSDFSLVGHTHSFGSISSKPTTLSGYGITDAVTINTAQTITEAKTFSSKITSTVSTGTAPFAIRSTTRVDNLHAERASSLQYWSDTTLSDANSVLESWAGLLKIYNINKDTLNGPGYTHSVLLNLGVNQSANSCIQIATAYLATGAARLNFRNCYNNKWGDWKTILLEDSDIPEAYLTWGGKSHIDSYGPIDSAMVPELSANRLAFMSPKAIEIEYSRDSGKTWSTYETTDNDKVSLFTEIGSAFVIGANDTAYTNTSTYQLRITITTNVASVYTILNKFCILASTNGSSDCWCTIEGKTKADVDNEAEIADSETEPDNKVDVWTTFADKVAIGGWSGYNIINTKGITTYGNKANQYQKLRFTFGCKTHSASYLESKGLSIYKIYGFGGTGWSTPSTLAKYGRLYTYDISLNATFPANVKATKFIGPLNGNADTATKLQTGRTIWGQSFDGTANVSDALTGVTDITMSGHINMTASEPTIKRNSENVIRIADAGLIITPYTTNGFIALRCGTKTDTSGAKELRILNNGNVGIGTTSPSYKLHINGTLGVTGTTTLGSTLSVSGATTLSSSLSVSGATTLSSSLSVSGKITAKNCHDFISHTNEFNFVPDSYSNYIYINYRTQSGTLDGSIKGYYFKNGANDWADIKAKNIEAVYSLVAGTTASIGSTLTVNGATTLKSALAVSGVATINNALNVNGNETISGTLKIGSATISWDATSQVLKIDKPLVSTSFASGATATASSEGGSGVLIFNSDWSEYNSSKEDYVLGASLGYDLHTRLNSAVSRISTLEEQQSSGSSGFYAKNATVNGVTYAMAGTDSNDAFNIYAPTSAGKSGQILVSTGGVPTWSNIPSLGTVTINIPSLILLDGNSSVSQTALTQRGLSPTVIANMTKGLYTKVIYGSGSAYQSWSYEAEYDGNLHRGVWIHRGDGGDVNEGLSIISIDNGTTWSISHYEI